MRKSYLEWALRTEAVDLDAIRRVFAFSDFEEIGFAEPPSQVAGSGMALMFSDGSTRIFVVPSGQWVVTRPPSSATKQGEGLDELAALLSRGGDPLR